MNGLNVIQNDIYHNGKEKLYPNGYSKITVASRSVYKESGWEERKDPPKVDIPISKPQTKGNASRYDSIYRAKQKVFDIVAMNGFKYFVTLTFSKEKINRYSVDEIHKKLLNWLRNGVRRNGWKYLVIPERHKDNAIHLHGLMSGELNLADSGTVIADGFSKPIKKETALKHNIPIEASRTVYNMPKWGFGFSTVIPTYGENEHCAKYITKYVTKDIDKIFGHYYLAGGDIVRDVPYRLFDADYEAFESKCECYCEEINTSFKYAERKEETDEIL